MGVTSIYYVFENISSCNCNDYTECKVFVLFYFSVAFRRVELPATYLSLVLGHLRSDDIYHQVSYD